MDSRELKKLNEVIQLCIFLVERRLSFGLYVGNKGL